MGRSARLKAQARAQRTSGTGQIRIPRQGDAEQFAHLMRMVVPDPENADEMSATMTTQAIPRWTEHNGERWGTGGTWVADGGSRGLLGALVVAPPLEWLTGMQAVSVDRAAAGTRSMVEAEFLAVAEDARGARIGEALLAHARRECAARGYRVMLGTVEEHNFGLLPYYRSIGFHVLPAGAPLVVVDPVAGQFLWRPSEPDIVQMWLPLHEGARERMTHTFEGLHPVVLGAMEIPPGSRDLTQATCEFSDALYGPRAN